MDRLENDTETVADIASRMAAKMDRYLAALDRLAGAAAGTVDDAKLSPSLVPCCSAVGPSLQPAHQWRPSRAFGGLTVNKAVSCELKHPDWPSGSGSADKDAKIQSSSFLLRHFVVTSSEDKNLQGKSKKFHLHFTVWWFDKMSVS